MNFESPYVDMPMRLTVRQNLMIFGRLYAVAESARADRAARGRSRSRRFPRPRQWQAIRRSEDAGCIGQGADQPAGPAAAGRADGLARSRYRRLDQAASGNLSPQTHGATILLASHNMLEVERLCDRVIIMKRGRIEDDDTPGRHHGPLQPGDAGGSVSRRRARPRSGNHAMSARREQAGLRGILSGIGVSRLIASARWCCATGIC